MTEQVPSKELTKLERLRKRFRDPEIRFDRAHVESLFNEAEHLQRELRIWMDATNEWIKANAPGGWIDTLRKQAAPEPPAAPNPFEDRARAWDAIARKLEEINPHTFEAHKTGLQCALDEIERLQDRSIVASEFAAKCVAAVGRDPNVESVNLFELADQVVGCIEQYKHEAERAAQPPVPDDTTRLNWWFMNVLHDSDDDESGSDIEYEARLCRTPDEFRKLIDAERGTVPTKGEAP